MVRYDINDDATRFSEDALTQRFEMIYGVGKTPQIAEAPGRANVIDEHVDYEGGVALPFVGGSLTSILSSASSCR